MKPEAFELRTEIKDEGYPYEWGVGSLADRHCNDGLGFVYDEDIIEEFRQAHIEQYEYTRELE